MGLLEFAFLFSAVVALYNFQQIKMALKDKGYTIEMFTGWLRDYRQFKALIENEPDQIRKISYQKNLNTLHFSLLGMLFFGVFILRKFT
jgi:uncharacterized membrane protein YiaA